MEYFNKKVVWSDKIKFFIFFEYNSLYKLKNYWKGIRVEIGNPVKQLLTVV